MKGEWKLWILLNGVGKNDFPHSVSYLLRNLMKWRNGCNENKWIQVCRQCDGFALPRVARCSHVVTWMWAWRCSDWKRIYRSNYFENGFDSNGGRGRTIGIVTNASGLPVKCSGWQCLRWGNGWTQPLDDAISSLWTLSPSRQYVQWIHIDAGCHAIIIALKSQ